jgi:hypothetical protein
MEYARQQNRNPIARVRTNPRQIAPMDIDGLGFIEELLLCAYII